MTVFEILLPAFVASLILTGIHAYLGVHVVERGVIFVDLSLAQIAAFGGTVGYLAGYDMHSTAPTRSRSRFTVLGAAIFAFTKTHRKTRIPQEAIIGIAYAVSAALAVLVMSKATRETEHLKEMLVGNILSVSWPELGKTAALYALVGALPLRLPRALPPHLAQRGRGRPPRLERQGVGLPVLRVVRVRRDELGRDRRRPPRLLFPDRAVGRRDALLRAPRRASRDRLDDGRRRVGRGRLAVVPARPPDGRGDRRDVRGRCS